MNRILMIHRQLAFAVGIKQALERTGSFTVHPFTSPDSALEYMAQQPMDVVLVDFGLPGVDGLELVRRVREQQQHVALIAMPRQEEAVMRDHWIQASLDTPFSARDLMPILNRAIDQARMGRIKPLSRPEPPAQPQGTVRFDEDDSETPDIAPPALTQRFVDDQPPTTRFGDERAQTMRLDDQPAQTTRFDDGPETPRQRTGMLSDMLDDDAPRFSTLDSVLADVGASGLFAPPDDSVLEESQSDEMLDDILAAISFNPEIKPTAPLTDFDSLVNSMRPEEPRKPLHERNPQLVEFILTSGMDNLITEIERKRPDTGSLSSEGESVSDRIAAEEPPLPAFEESGTVGDLLLGVSDSSFRSVLSLLRGEEQPQTPDDAGDDDDDESAEALYLAQFKPPTPPLPEVEHLPEPPPEDTPARMILQAALDGGDTSESFSLADLMANIERQIPAYKPPVRPLPSWGEAAFTPQPEVEPLDENAEPEFLSELPELDFTGQFADQTTRPHRVELVDEPQVRDFETELLELPQRSQPAAAEPPAELPILDIPDVGWEDWSQPSAPMEEAAAPPVVLSPDMWADMEQPAAADAEREDEAPAVEWGAWEDAPQTDVLPDDESWAAETMPHAAVTVPETPPAEPEAVSVPASGDDGWDFESGLFDTAFERLAAFEFSGAPQDTPVTGMPPVTEDPYIAELALSLTQASLELTAEATMLTQRGRIIAYAGAMAREDVEALLSVIGEDWDASPGQARVRFVTLPDSGKDYMLYSRHTDDNLTLSMIFAGSTPLRDIRRQGKRLAEALNTVPEAPTPAVEEIAIDESVVIRSAAPVLPAVSTSPYAYVWLVRDPSRPLTERAARAVESGLSVQLRERGWRIQTLDAQGDYVYLLADVPGDDPAQSVVRELKRRALEIARLQEPALDDGLWADSYLIVAPGRPLETDEIRQFIEFQHAF